MPTRVQAKLHRVLRDREAVLTDRARVELDIRPIAAVEPGFENAVEEGRLRRDLYDRLSLIRIELPPMRQRREDIPFLANHFLKEICRSNGAPLKTLTRSAVTLLGSLPWRGNAPELRALLERLVLLTPHGSIRLEDVLAQVRLDGSEVAVDRRHVACGRPGCASSATTSPLSSGSITAGWARRPRRWASSAPTSTGSSASSACRKSAPDGGTGLYRPGDKATASIHKPRGTASVA